jgi:hypothetical protein
MQRFFIFFIFFEFRMLILKGGQNGGNDYSWIVVDLVKFLLDL